MNEDQQSRTPPASEDDDEYDDYDPEEGDGEDDDEGGDANPEDDAPPARRSRPAKTTAAAAEIPAVVPDGTVRSAPSRKGNEMEDTQQNDQEAQLNGDDILKAIQEGTADGVERVLLARLVPIEKAVTAMNSSLGELITVQNATGEGYQSLVAENVALQKSISELHGELTLLKSVNVNLDKALGGTAGGGDTAPTGKIKPSDVLIKAGVAAPGDGSEGSDADESDDVNNKLVAKALGLQAFGRTPDGLTAILKKAAGGEKPTEDDFATLRKGVGAIK